MSKPIKVSDDVYQRLKAVADKNYRSLGKQIEYFLDAKGVTGEVGKITAPQKIPEKNNFGASPDVSDLLKAPEYDPKVAERQQSGELNCCLDELKPCKHWVWDSATGEGYKNVLSGRFMEVE